MSYQIQKNAEQTILDTVHAAMEENDLAAPVEIDHVGPNHTRDGDLYETYLVYFTTDLAWGEYGLYIDVHESGDMDAAVCIAEDGHPALSDTTDYRYESIDRAVERIADAA